MADAKEIELVFEPQDEGGYRSIVRMKRSALPLVWGR
jgi:hypothetical protein